MRIAVRVTGWMPTLRSPPGCLCYLSEKYASSLCLYGGSSSSCLSGVLFNGCFCTTERGGDSL